MTQLIMIKKPVGLSLPPKVQLTAIDDRHAPAPAAATHYFATTADCYFATDPSGRSESLIDDVWEAQQAGLEITNTPFCRVATILFEFCSPFICWCGSDYLDLPAVTTLPQFLSELKRQTARQPADVYLRCSPE